MNTKKRMEMLRNETMMDEAIASADLASKVCKYDVSDCCGATFSIDGDDKEGTHYFLCDNCDKPCNLIEVINNKSFKAVDINGKEHKDFPYSVSEWEDIGRERGYFHFFEGKVRNEMKHEILYHIPFKREPFNNENNIGFNECVNEISEIIHGLKL